MNSQDNLTLQSELFSLDSLQQRIACHDPVKMPLASGFLWNKNMMIHMNCRGYAVSQFMQPEPSKYSHAPNMAAKSFMQPEQSYFSHHPGRFFYIKSNTTGEVISLPYEPTRQPLDRFTFSVGLNNIQWHIEHWGVAFNITLSLTSDDIAEFWKIEINNLTDESREFSFYPYFSIGYMSWLNQSARFCQQNNAIVATSITPYQQLEDYYKNQSLRDKTYLLAEHEPSSWCCNQTVFEGEGNLANPDGLQASQLGKENASYETPVAVMQYDIELNAQQSYNSAFIFGACTKESDISALREKYFANNENSQTKNWRQAQTEYQQYIGQCQGTLEIDSPNILFNQFVNHWLPRQVFYHGDSNRLTTDPQTRNYLQDAMGMCFISPDKTREAILRTCRQQYASGALPDGILLHPDAEIKYINLVPHSDHCVWLPLCLQVYLDETNDQSILQEQVTYRDTDQAWPISEHIERALTFLIKARDERGLSYIAQGDWCDPLNMVGHKGKGVSSWLSLATAYALNVWCQLSKHYPLSSTDTCQHFQHVSQSINQAVNTLLWDGEWFARGITDDDKLFGVANDTQGRIYLNPQSWSILSGAASKTQITQMQQSINAQLQTPFGPMMLAPSYTEMREDIGRLTQKHPGVSENGSVYNHASIFYAYSLYQAGKSDEALAVILKMLPNEKDIMTRQQLPSFIPNYYRGAYYQLPQTAGRSSQLFNTGTVAWLYRTIIEELCGLKGEAGRLMITPKLPSYWQSMTITRTFQSATFMVKIIRKQGISEQQTFVDNTLQRSNCVEDIRQDGRYQVEVYLPEGGAEI